MEDFPPGPPPPQGPPPSPQPPQSPPQFSHDEIPPENFGTFPPYPVPPSNEKYRSEPFFN
jgi:hypothetical protein